MTIWLEKLPLPSLRYQAILSSFQLAHPCHRHCPGRTTQYFSPLYFAGYELVISTTADETRSVYAADLHDGDMDVHSVSVDDDKIVWYRNNGKGSFSSELVITTAADGART
jgi:hypothetical protein